MSKNFAARNFWGFVPAGLLCSLLLSFCALLSPAAASAGENAGVTAAPILQLNTSARAAGMGSAFTAVSDDASALLFNPAGLSLLDHRELSFDYMKGFVDQNVEHISLVSPLPLSGLLGNGYASMGGSMLFAQNGTIEVNRTNPDGSLRDSRSISAGGDFVGQLAYSERLLETTLENERGGRALEMNHYFGFAGKYIRSTLAEQYSASAFAGDAGYLVKIPDYRLTLGAAAQNFGSEMKFIEEGDPLPLTFRGGAAWVLPLDAYTNPPNQALLFSGDGDWLYHEKEWHANLGIEYSAMRTYSARIGYQLNRDAAGLTFGFGVLWQGLRFDYAWALSEALGDVHRFSVTWRFGRVSQRKREVAPRPFIESMPEREDIREIEKKTPEVIEDRPRRPRRTISDNDVAPGWIY
ncbi:MAG: PorV/PorQ family protein [Elusimicrobiota bacterium]|jgi:hypothetical protein